MKNLAHLVGILAITFFLWSPEISYGQVKIGDLHEGGIVFYVDESGEHGLICNKEDLGEVTWDDAEKACKEFGNEWRLPSKDELNLMYTNLHKKGLGGFGNVGAGYWSSTEYDDSYAWGQVFNNVVGQGIFNKAPKGRIRAVRAFYDPPEVMDTSEVKKEFYKIGDSHDDGIVFYVDESGEHGLVCQTKDLGSMYWGDAVKACKGLGNEWRLPTKEELNLMYTNLHEKGLGGFAYSVYWSSTEPFSLNAWFQDFYNGFQNYVSKGYRDFHVRPVRAF